MRSISTPFRARTATLMLMTAVGLASAFEATAGAIVVGRDVGPGRPCTVATVQAAIERANGFGGHNLILVTDDVPDAVHHENLNLRSLSQNLTLELVGGYNNCAELQPTAFGKASLYGGDRSAPVMNIEGGVNLKLRGFWMEGGTTGIYWDGHGRVELRDTTVNNNDYNGIQAQKSSIYTPQLEVLGGVHVTNNLHDGIYLRGASLKVRGDGNRIRANKWSGVVATAGAWFDIGATGPVISDNRQMGVHLSLQDGAPDSLIFSTSINALDIADNNTSASSSYSAILTSGRLCLRNVMIRGNNGSAIDARGPDALVEFNGSSCSFPAEADIACNANCGVIARNRAPSSPVIDVTNGARVDLHRVRLINNEGYSLLSTNFATTPGAAPASITTTNSVAIGNVLRDNIVEALRGSVVDIWDSTITENAGGFQVSLVGVNPTLLQLTNTIVDQPQTLLDLVGFRATANLQRVLARNERGAEDVPRTMLIGQPTFANSSAELNPRSLGVDFAPAGGGVDIDGRPRDVDTLGVPNTHGPRDLGAYEVQTPSIDHLFRSGFEREPSAFGTD